MVGALFDTNILIDYLNGLEPAKKELDLYPDKAISLVTWMEVMVGATTESDTLIRNFLSGFVNLPIDKEVADVAVSLRQQKRIKLPDAIVWATALVNKRLLVTRNTKDFSADEPGTRVPYKV
jgi:predicted nucleic acid-binding protein